MPKVTIICRRCGVEFSDYECNGRIYCSAACSARCIAKTHGEARSRLYCIWCSMKARCSNPNAVGYEYYGGRGIRVCALWASSFVAFRDWALSSGYCDSLQLDRKENDLGYFPENCRWATRQQQMRNTRKRKDAVTSRYRGVSWCEGSGKWRVQICGTSRASVHVGLFDDEIEAAKAYDAVARKEFGEFASPNF